RSPPPTVSPRLMLLAATRTSVAPTVFSTVSTCRGAPTIFFTIKAAPRAAVKAMAITINLALFIASSLSKRACPARLTLRPKSQREVNARTKLADRAPRNAYMREELGCHPAVLKLGRKGRQLPRAAINGVLG